MNVLTSTAVLFAVLAGCYGYSYIIPATIDMPGVCFYNGKILPSGDSQVPGVCQNTLCNVNGSIKIDGCGPISLPNCTLIMDPTSTASYPDCCDMTYQCLDANGKTYTKIWNQLYPDGKPIEKMADFKNVLKQLKLSKQGNSKAGEPFVLQFLLV